MKQDVKIYDKNCAYIGTYSVELHGENFMELAEGFAKKINGSLDVPMDVTSVLERAFEKSPELKEKADELIEKVENAKKNACECGFIAKSATGLTAHKRKHKMEETTVTTPEEVTPEVAEETAPAEQETNA